RSDLQRPRHQPDLRHLRVHRAHPGGDPGALLRRHARPHRPPATTLRGDSRMTTNEYVRAFAGAFVLISLALGVEASPLFVSKHFLWVTGFVGLNLFQSAFTGLCPLVN